MGVTDLQVLQAFKKGQLELFYRRIYPGLLLYVLNCRITQNMAEKPETKEGHGQNSSVSGSDLHE